MTSENACETHKAQSIIFSKRLNTSLKNRIISKVNAADILSQEKNVSYAKHSERIILEIDRLIKQFKIQQMKHDAFFDSLNTVSKTLKIGDKITLTSEMLDPLSPFDDCIMYITLEKLPKENQWKQMNSME